MNVVLAYPIRLSTTSELPILNCVAVRTPVTFISFISADPMVAIPAGSTSRPLTI